jgi:hypothetical protein
MSPHRILSLSCLVHVLQRTLRSCWVCPVAGSGKTFLLEGTRAKDVTRMGTEGDGVVHLAADELFKQLHQRAAAIGAPGCTSHRVHSRS